jgi:hypothetical protein
MARKPPGKPPSQRHGYRPGGGHRFRPLNFSAVELDVAYERTVSAKTPDPVVFVINLDDEIGAKLARETFGSETVAEIRTDYRHGPEAPRLTFASECVEDASAILGFHFENCAKVLETPIPPGHFRVIVIDRGGVTCHPRPIPG